MQLVLLLVSLLASTMGPRKQSKLSLQVDVDPQNPIPTILALEKDQLCALLKGAEVKHSSSASKDALQLLALKVYKVGPFPEGDSTAEEEAQIATSAQQGSPLEQHNQLLSPTWTDLQDLQVALKRRAEGAESCAQAAIAKVEVLVGTVKELQRSLEFTQWKLDELQKRTPTQDQITKQFRQQQQASDARAAQIAAQTAQAATSVVSERNKVVLSGLEEAPEETDEEALAKAQYVVGSLMGLGDSVQLKAAQRLGRRQEDTGSAGSRKLLVTIATPAQASQLCRSGRKLAPHNSDAKAAGKRTIGIDPSLTREQLRIRASLYPQFQAAKGAGQSAYWRGHRLFVGGCEVTPETGGGPGVSRQLPGVLHGPARLPGPPQPQPQPQPQPALAPSPVPDRLPRDPPAPNRAPAAVGEPSTTAPAPTTGPWQGQSTASRVRTDVREPSSPAAAPASVPPAAETTTLTLAPATEANNNV